MLKFCPWRGKDYKPFLLENQVEKLKRQVEISGRKLALKECFSLGSASFKSIHPRGHWDFSPVNKFSPLGHLSAVFFWELTLIWCAVTYTLPKTLKKKKASIFPETFISLL